MATRIEAKLQEKRGTLASMPTLMDGQLYLSYDKRQIHKGTPNGTNVKVSDMDLLEDVKLYSGTCIFNDGNFEITASQLPLPMPDIFSIRIKTPQAWVDGSHIIVGGVTFTPVNPSFETGEILTINFDNGGTKNCFFKSGGGVGANETLPRQVATFTAVSSNAQIVFNWTLTDNVALNGFYLTYKLGNTAPTKPDDGTKIDITNIATTHRVVTGLTNGSQYTAMIFPYNAKKQVQTIPISATATPTSGTPLSSLAIGTNVKFNDTSGVPVTFKIVDKNHSGYPSNSITLMCWQNYINRSLSGDSLYPASGINEYLNDSVSGFISKLPTTLRNVILNTTIKCDNSATTTQDIITKCFLPSTFEFAVASNLIQKGNQASEGIPFSYFTPTNIGDTIRVMWTRTPQWRNGFNGYWITKPVGLYDGEDYINNAYGIRPIINVPDNILSVLPSVNSDGSYNLNI